MRMDTVLYGLLGLLGVGFLLLPDQQPGGSNFDPIPGQNRPRQEAAESPQVGTGAAYSGGDRAATQPQQANAVIDDSNVPETKDGISPTVDVETRRAVALAAEEAYQASRRP